jgi:glycosyltransferase involved in cell wall biosynthesis
MVLMNTPKVFFFSEDLRGPFDEGIKSAAVRILKSLEEKAAVFCACRSADPSIGKALEFRRINRLLLSFKLRRTMRGFNPDIIIYLPRWGGTFAGFLRMRILKQSCRRAKAVLVILQPKDMNRLQRKILRFLKPDRVMTPSPRVRREMREAGIPVDFLPLYTDRKKFNPLVDPGRRDELRREHRLPLDKFLILHVGHINGGRNLEALIPLQDEDCQVVVVGSTSTSTVAYKDENLKRTLLAAGVIVRDDYLERIEEVYQSADLYVFPVVRDIGCIALPLSVLEARACSLPVLTTDFGGLRELFGDRDTDIVFAEPADFLRVLRRLRAKPANSSGPDQVERVNRLFLEAVYSLVKA